MVELHRKAEGTLTGPACIQQVILEMIEVREVDTARALLRTQVFMRVKQEEPDRFLRLEHLCGKTYLDIRRGRQLAVVQNPAQHRVLQSVVQSGSTLCTPECTVQWQVLHLAPMHSLAVLIGTMYSQAGFPWQGTIWRHVTGKAACTDCTSSVARCHNSAPFAAHGSGWPGAQVVGAMGPRGSMLLALLLAMPYLPTEMDRCVALRPDRLEVS